GVSRGRLAGRAVGGVKSDGVVVVAVGEKRHVEAGLAAIDGQLEAEDVSVEADRAVEVGDLQVYMSDLHGCIVAAPDAGSHRGHPPDFSVRGTSADAQVVFGMCARLDCCWSRSRSVLPRWPRGP